MILNEFGRCLDEFGAVKRQTQLANVQTVGNGDVQLQEFAAVV